MSSQLEERIAAQQRTHKKRIWRITAIILAIAAVAGAAYFWLAGGTKRTGEGLAATPENKINILVLGVDERSDDVGRSDTTFVVTIDTKTREVSLLSIPRDSRVKIPGHGWDKINHAFAYGGPKLTRQAVEDLLGIPVDYYVTINFAGFYKIVDAVGGVTIDVDKRMYYEDPWDNLVIDLRPGVQRLDGKTAIQYVRYRDEEGDIGRIARQQKFLKAMLNEIANPSVILRLPGIIKEVSAVVQTDMPTAKMLELANIVNDAQKNGLKTDMVPGKPAYINDISYWIPDIPALRQHVAQIMGIPADNTYVANAQKTANEYQTNIPREMKVIDVPKTAQAPKSPANSPASRPGDKSASVPAGSKPPVPDRLRAEVINASGSPDAGSSVAAALRSQGFEVVGISTMGSPQRLTVVTSHTTSSSVVGKVSSLPFKYALQVSKDDASPVQVTVVIGQDYAGK